MTDRDHFAAAALTGLLYPEVDDEFAMPYIVGRAYLWADAMLRERSRAGQNSSDGTDSAAKCTERDSANHDAALTDAERDDLRVWSAECVRQASTAMDGGNEELAERWMGRAWRAAAMIERLRGGR